MAEFNWYCGKFIPYCGEVIRSGRVQPVLWQVHPVLWRVHPYWPSSRRTFGYDVKPHRAFAQTRVSFDARQSRSREFIVSGKRVAHVAIDNPVNPRLHWTCRRAKRKPNQYFSPPRASLLELCLTRFVLFRRSLLDNGID